MRIQTILTLITVLAVGSAVAADEALRPIDGDEITIGVVHLLFEFPEAEEAQSAAPKRKSLDEVFETAASAGKKPGATADDIETLADVTRIATVLKYGGIVVAGIVLLVIAVRGPDADDPRPIPT